MLSANAQRSAATPVQPSDIQSFLWPLPGSRLTDQEGRVLEPTRLRDKVVVVAFTSTACSAICIARLLALEEVFRALPPAVAERMAFVAVGADPVRDDPAALRKFADSLGMVGAHWTMLAGDAETLARQQARALYPSAPNPQDDPPATVLVFDRVGHTAMAYGGDLVDRPRLARDLTLLERFEQGVGHPARPAPDDLHPLSRTN